VRNPNTIQLILDSLLPNNIHLLALRKLEHVLQVRRRRIRRREDILDVALDAELVKLGFVGSAGLCCVVGDEEDAFAEFAEVGEGVLDA
jgi:hypothetical protein